MGPQAPGASAAARAAVLRAFWTKAKGNAATVGRIWPSCGSVTRARNLCAHCTDRADGSVEGIPYRHPCLPEAGGTDNCCCQGVQCQLTHVCVVLLWACRLYRLCTRSAHQHCCCLTCCLHLAAAVQACSDCHAHCRCRCCCLRCATAVAVVLLVAVLARLLLLPDRLRAASDGCWKAPAPAQQCVGRGFMLAVR